MVGSTIAVIAPTSIRVILDFVAANQGNTPLVFTGITTRSEFTTNSLVFVNWFTAAYTIDLNGVLSVVDIFFYLLTSNDVNSILKIQISKDGGVSFVDATGEIGFSGLFDDLTMGSGNWISSIDTGQNKLQIRVQAKSTTGANATARIRGDSYLKLVYNKKVI